MGMGGNGNGNVFMGMGGNGNRNSPARTPLAVGLQRAHLNNITTVRGLEMLPTACRVGRVFIINLEWTDLSHYSVIHAVVVADIA